MTRVTRASDLEGMPVVTLDTATTVAELRDVLFDPERSSVIGFTLRGRGLLSSPLLGILPVEWVRAIGRDAVMIASEDSLVRDRDGMQTTVGQQEEIIGKEVVTDTGASLGTIKDVVMDVEGPSARVVGYEIDRPDGHQIIVPVTGPVPISGDALVLPADSEQRAAGGLSAFRDAIEQRRQQPRARIMRT